MTSNKQYGLILPKKQQEKTAPKLSNVFGDDNASDEDDGTDWVKKALKAEGEKNKMKKQTKLDIQKALNEDPTIYQYDEVYDDMERTKSQANLTKQKEKKPRYIQNLLKTADRRKKEQEHRIERMVQKEREAEGDMYADKESFVTSAYRAKLEEFKEMEEEEARMNRLEAIGDVTKQQDMSGFYRHLYEQTVDYKGETNEDGSNKTTGEEMEKKNSTSSTEVNREEENSTVDKITNTIDERQKVITKSKKSRQYRQRAIETYESDSETETSKEDLKKEQTLTPPANEDINQSEISQEPDRKKQKQDKNDVNKVENAIDTKHKNSNVKDTEVSEDHKEAVASENEKIESKEKPVEKDRSSIWQKRTVGPIFEAALQRYYIRKAKRLAAAS